MYLEFLFTFAPASTLLLHIIFCPNFLLKFVVLYHLFYFNRILFKKIFKLYYLCSSCFNTTHVWDDYNVKISGHLLLLCSLLLSMPSLEDKMRDYRSSPNQRDVLTMTNSFLTETTKYSTVHILYLDLVLPQKLPLLYLKM